MPNLDSIHAVLAGGGAQEGPEPLTQRRRDRGAALFNAESAVEPGADV